MLRFTERPIESVGMSPYLQRWVFKHILQSFSKLYVSLHFAEPGAEGDNEIDGGSYERQLVDFSVIQGDLVQVQSTETLRFSNMPFVKLTHIGLWDARTGGNFLWPGALIDETGHMGSQQFYAGDRAEFSVGDLLALFED